MNKTRKLLALVLSLVMVFAIAIPASADYPMTCMAHWPDMPTCLR